MWHTHTAPDRFMNAAETTNGEALAIFAHELRQPLASILFAVQSLCESVADEAASREMCEVVERQAGFLAQMIEDVLEVNWCCRGKLRLERATVDLGSIIAGAIETTQPLFSARGHRLSILLPEPPVSVMADRVRLQQVITNLLVNAAKYTAPGGHISLRVEATPELTTIEVRDNGMGIPPELLPQIFDLFVQGGAAEQCSRCGLGIGLALVKSLVELHEGRISAYSDGTGTGATFVIQLPGLGRSHF